MYEQHFGLTEKPFSMTPDPGFFFIGSRHGMGLSMLQYGLENRAGIMVLTGEIGAGKTTLIRRLLDEFGDDQNVGLISNTHVSFGNLMQWVSVAFGLPVDSDSKAVLFEKFADHLIEQYGQGRRTVLIVDEAQNLDETTLEELRLMTNINADKDQLLQIILSGQPELRAKLRSPTLEQFVQRVAVDFHLTPLDPVETEEYVGHRVTVAGGSRRLFTPSACRFIHYQAGGVPRLINSLCDTALVYAFAAGDEIVEDQTVYDMVVERIKEGLFGAGNLSYNAVTDSDPERAFKKSRQRARRRATYFLRKARRETAPPVNEAAMSARQV